jgi:hypothetical protein
VSGVWDKQGAKTLPVGTTAHPVRKMLAIGNKIWCAVHNCIKIIDTEALELEVGSFDNQAC